jgi:hypothetical protein
VTEETFMCAAPIIKGSCSILTTTSRLYMLKFDGSAMYEKGRMLLLELLKSETAISKVRCSGRIMRFIKILNSL